MGCEMIGQRYNRDTGHKGRKWDRSQHMRSRVKKIEKDLTLKKAAEVFLYISIIQSCRVDQACVDFNSFVWRFHQSPKLVGASYTSSWNICCYPLDKNQISSITTWTNYLQTAAVLPALFKTTVKILDDPKDTFILMHGWSKGVIFVNGRNLGRYWVTKGPQKTLYLPASWLIKGENEIIWLEEEQLGMTIELVSSTDLG
ncbi:unnamed protein product [Oikopleura dioica]|uniref:Beta-galactosidase galactose-binding domain-containing protein n=1 Tax=Oikopleura dioica TaxID=34765 RepID=E4YE52_OIKDI|nr:unnamed protein product [Oikopleura dioica]